MKLTILRNIGTDDLKKLGADRKDLLEGATVDVPEKLGNELLKRGLAEAPAVRGVPTGAAVRGVPQESSGRTVPLHQETQEDESPVEDETAREAIADISRMRSKEKLQEIINTDHRSTVVEAARKRLAEI